MREYRSETFFFERGKTLDVNFFEDERKIMEDFGKGGGEKENSVQKDTEEYIGKWKADFKKGKTGRGDSKKKCNRSENRLHG